MLIKRAHESINNWVRDQLANKHSPNRFLKVTNSKTPSGLYFIAVKTRRNSIRRLGSAAAALGSFKTAAHKGPIPEHWVTAFIQQLLSPALLAKPCIPTQFNFSAIETVRPRILYKYPSSASVSMAARHSNRKEVPTKIE